MSGDFKKYFPLLSVGIAILAVFFIFADNSYAQEIDKDKALRIMSEQGGPGGCDSDVSCSDFCDNNLEVCLNWAKDNGVISSENHEKHSNFVQQGGPGGCKTPETCRSYCDNESNFDTCLEFGQKHGLISEEQAQRARKTGPGGCKTQKECQSFCENPQNHDVCIDHAVQEGFMTREEAERMREFRDKEKEFRRRSEEFRKETRRPEGPKHVEPGFDENKALQIISSQGGPGGCATFEACEVFCDNPNNQAACFDFAEKHELFTNKEEMKKMRQIMKDGGPGGCRGERECHQFCENEANFEVCISFAEKSGLMTPEEIERAKKGIQALKEGGPGGCKTREACDKVCQDPANQQSCFEWAKKHGLISDEELRFIEEAQKMREEFENKQHEFENRPPEGFKPPEGFRPPGEFLGPGGCTGAEECRKYCEDPAHQEECGGFKTPSRQQPPGFEGDQPSEFNRPPETFSDPSVECANHGGSWTGATCEFPRQEEFQSPPPEFKQEQEPTSQPTSFIEHPFLGAMLRYLLK